ncbi:hypothetical protein ACPYO6_02620 [Georgenia sp. Z1344]|uniref:hypothetical protein n=1 Tax=Georgenia sp. Z1344 TaxID=3416706 RepID=UPI003CFA729E
MDMLRHAGDALPRVLRTPDERPHAWEGVAYMAGAERFGPRPRFDLGSPLDMLLGLPTDYTADLADSVVTGVSLIGWPDCLATEVRDAIDRCETFPYLLVTSHRVVLTTNPLESAPEILWDLPRDVVRGARRRGRLLQAGRVELVLADGSLLRVMLGLVLTGAARRLVVAFATTARPWGPPWPGARPDRPRPPGT